MSSIAIRPSDLETTVDGYENNVARSHNLDNMSDAFSEAVGSHSPASMTKVLPGSLRRQNLHFFSNSLF